MFSFLTSRRFWAGTLLLGTVGGIRPAQAQGLAGPTAVTHSPYYHAYRPQAVPGAAARIGVLPVRLEHAAASRILKETRAPELLDSLTRCLGRQPGLTLAKLPDGAKPSHLPDVYFGSPDQELPTELPPYLLNLSNPNPGKGVVQLAGWNGQGKTRQAFVALMAAQHLDYLLVPVLRESSLYLSMKTKSVGPFSGGRATGNDYYLDEGSGHVVHFTRLNDLNSTVTVLTLAAALLDAKGNLVLVGAEGLKEGGVGFDAKRLTALKPYDILAADYEALLRPIRRDDLPTTPPAWQEAATQLAQRLSGRRPYREDSPYQFLLVDLTDK